MLPEKIPSFIVNMPTCLIGIEACSGAHYWARSFQQFGHMVKLMPPQFVKSYVKTNKNGNADPEAICETVTRPSMRFVPKKLLNSNLCYLHKARERLVSINTGQINQVRGLLAEFGIIIPRGIASFNRQLPLIVEDTECSGTLSLATWLEVISSPQKRTDDNMTKHSSRTFSPEF